MNALPTPGAVKPRVTRRSARAMQRGAVALVVVLALTLIVALAALHAGRQLVFEQRTAANQVRATQAFEAAEAGLAWALAMLNGGRIDDLCRPLADPAQAGGSLRERHLTVDPLSGHVAVRRRSDGTALTPACVFDGGEWRCSCPQDALPTLPTPVEPATSPVFQLRFAPVATRPDVVRVEATACSRVDAACLAGQPGADASRATVSTLVAIKGALASPPVAALTVGGALTLGGATVELVNTDRRTGGITLHTAGTIDGALPVRLSVPGTPADASTIVADPTWATRSAEQRFVAVFGLPRTTYRRQPALVELACDGPCTAAQVRTAATLHPGRVLWLPRGLTVDEAGELGSPAAPLLLVVEEHLSVTAGHARLHGLLYTSATTLVLEGQASLRGAFVAESDLAITGGGALSVIRDADTLQRLRMGHGSLVRVPGSWRDF